jgi:hypothetical protein
MVRGGGPPVLSSEKIRQSGNLPYCRWRAGLIARLPDYLSRQDLDFFVAFCRVEYGKIIGV